MLDRRPPREPDLADFPVRGIATGRTVVDRRARPQGDEPRERRGEHRRRTVDRRRDARRDTSRPSAVYVERRTGDRRTDPRRQVQRRASSRFTGIDVRTLMAYRRTA